MVNLYYIYIYIYCIHINNIYTVYNVMYKVRRGHKRIHHWQQRDKQKQYIWLQVNNFCQTSFKSLSFYPQKYLNCFLEFELP